MKRKSQASFHRLIAMIATIIVVGAPVAVWACPACKEALFDPGQLQQKLSAAKGYALSIGLMLAMPVGLIGGITTLILRAQRRLRLRNTRPDLHD